MRSKVQITVQKRIIQILFCSSILFITILKYLLLGGKQKYGKILLQRMQHEILNKTARWRGMTPICYKGYCGPWIEEYYFDYFIKTNPDTDRIYLPISWTNCHIYCTKEEKEALRTFVFNLDPNFKYFSVIQIARGLHHPALNIHIPDGIDMLLFSAGGYTTAKGTDNVPIPLLKAPLKRKLETGRKHIVSFVGSLSSHPLRHELHTKYSNMFYFASGNDWETTMESSFFSLCPRGYGPTSFRLYEALQLESVPIYVWDEEILLPFSDLIDWSTISVIVHRTEINGLLLNVLERNLTEYMAEIKKVKHYFSYSFTMQYINQRISSK